MIRFVGVSVALAIFIVAFLRFNELHKLFMDLWVLFGAGFLNGGLHALSAPDHLAALIPFSIGKRWWEGMYFGASWSIGHGISAFIIGYTGYQLTHLSSMSSDSTIEFLTRMSGFAVGITLTVIGLMGVYEITSETAHDVIKNQEPQFTQTPSGKFKPKKTLSASALFLNGLLLGFSWDSLPSLAPVMLTADVDALLRYLGAYVFGTVLCVMLAAGIIGECTTFLVNKIADLPVKLALIASTISVVIGSIWLGNATHELLHPQALDTDTFPTAALWTALAAGTPLALLGIMVRRLPANKESTE